MSLSLVRLLQWLPAIWMLWETILPYGEAQQTAGGRRLGQWSTTSTNKQTPNDKLAEHRRARSLAIARTMQGSAQLVAVNCSSRVINFEAVIAIYFTGNVSSLTPDQLSLLGQVFQSTYNKLAEGFCDPFFRTVDKVEFVRPDPSGSRRLELHQTGHEREERRELLFLTSLLFFVSGRCRGCSDNTGLFNDAASNRRRQLNSIMEGMASPALRGMTFRLDSTTNPRHLQQRDNGTVQCFCDAGSTNITRAPLLSEFGAAFNRSVATTNKASNLTVTTVDEPSNISVSFPPTETPMQRKNLAPTPTPTENFSNDPALLTQVPTATSSPTVASIFPSATAPTV